MSWKFEKSFREAHPETIGETDSHFDLDNYKDWLEKQLEAKDKTIASLQESHDFLECLESAGVDNWDGYELAQCMMKEDYGY